MAGIVGVLCNHTQKQQILKLPNHKKIRGATVTRFFMITEEKQFEIRKIWETCIHEGVTGRLYCTNLGLNKIAKIIGKDYSIMGKEKKKHFRMDVVSSYQMGFFKQYGEY